MKNATVSELKNHLSKFLRYVKQGERVTILDRGEPIAEIQPRPAHITKADDFLKNLEVKGIIRRGDSRKMKNFSYPKGKGSSGVLETLLYERREGR